MAKLITIHPEKPNAILVEGGYFPLPIHTEISNDWHKILSANYVRDNVNGNPFVKPTFDKVAELVGFSLVQRYKQKEGRKTNLALDPIIESLNDENKVIIGDTLWVISDKKLYVINHPDQELVDQFGVDNQEFLEKLVNNFDAQLKGRKESGGVTYAEDIASVSVANISQGPQSRNPVEENYFGRNLGLIASVRSNKVAKDLAVGANEYKNEPYFSLNLKTNNLATRIPLLFAGSFNYSLCLMGGEIFDFGNGCSFNYCEDRKYK